MFKLASSVSLLALSVAAPSVAQDAAQDDDTSVEEITVTAQFREQKLSDVPLAITAYDGAFLNDLGIDTFDELSEITPGFLVQVQSVNNPGFVLRGVTSDDGAATVEPRVSVFLNNVSIARSRGSAVPLFDVERVEVLKGPQGTLFGRSAQVGAVHYITNKANFETEGGFSLEGGSLGTYGGNAFVNVPLVEDELGLRLAAYYFHRDGIIENTNGGRLNGIDTMSFRASVRYQPNDDFTLDLISNFTRDTPPGTSFKSGVIPALGGNTDPNDDASLNSFGGFEELGIERDVFDITAIVDYTINDSWSLISTTAYRTFESFESFDPDGTAFDLFIFGEDADSEQFSSDIRFAYDSGSNWRGFFGGGIFAESGTQSVPLGFDIGNSVGLFQSLNATSAPVDGVAFFGGIPPLADAFLTGDPAVLAATLGAIGIPSGVYQEETFANSSDNFAWDIFGEVEVDLTEKLTLTLGGRFTVDYKETLFESFINQPNPVTPLILGGAPAFLVGDSGGQISSDTQAGLDDTFTGFSWRAVMRYQITDDASIYANYSRGRRPSVIEDDFATQPDGTASANFVVVPEETVDNYEVGMNGTFYDGKLTVNAALYYLDYNNFQTTVTVDAGPGQPPLFELVNGGAANSYGAEMGFNYQATEYFSVFGTYGWNRGRFNDFDSNGTPQLFGGNQFRLSPDHAFSIGYNLEVPSDIGTWYLRPVYTWRSDVFFEDENQEAFDVVDPATGTVLWSVPRIGEDAVGQLDVRAGIILNDSNIRIEAFADNLFDSDFIIDGGNTGGAFGIPTFIAGAPLIVGGRISVGF